MLDLVLGTCDVIIVPFLGGRIEWLIPHIGPELHHAFGAHEPAQMVLSHEQGVLEFDLSHGLVGFHFLPFV